MTDTQQQTATESDALPSIPPTQPAEPKLEPTHQESPALGGSSVGKQSAVELPNQCTAAAVAPAPVAPAAAQQANQPTAALAQPPSAAVQQAQQAVQQSPAAAAGAAALPVHSQQPSKQGGTITPAAANGGQVKAPGPLPVRPYLETTVVPVLMQALQQLVRERPEDPLGYVADYLNKNNPKRQKKA